jgi:hypothetical protein
MRNRSSEYNREIPSRLQRWRPVTPNPYSKTNPHLRQLVFSSAHDKQEGNAIGIAVFRVAFSFVADSRFGVERRVFRAAADADPGYTGTGD